MTQETRQVCEDIIKLKDGKFTYEVGKATPRKFYPRLLAMEDR